HVSSGAAPLEPRVGCRRDMAGQLGRNRVLARDLLEETEPGHARSLRQLSEDQREGRLAHPDQFLVNGMTPQGTQIRSVEGEFLPTSGKIPEPTLDGLMLLGREGDHLTSSIWPAEHCPANIGQPTIGQGNAPSDASMWAV